MTVSVEIGSFAGPKRYEKLMKTTKINKGYWLTKVLLNFRCFSCCSSAGRANCGYRNGTWPIPIR